MSKHDQVANKLANREGTEYNKGPGADIQGSRRIIEVETPSTIAEAAQQLAGYRKPVYVVPTNHKAVPKAVEHYRGTTIGVMTPMGRIVKRSTRARS